ncbi:MAG: GNAT family protein, partial [Alphaproteobacteria bacterium]
TWLGSHATRTASGEILNCAIELKAMPGLVGVIGLTGIRSIEGGRIAELGYWLAKPFWSKGIMSEAGRALVRHAFEDLDFAGLKSGHFKENHRSGRVLAKLGFRYAGEGLKHCLARNAETPHVDVVMTRAQWLDHTARRAA